MPFPGFGAVACVFGLIPCQYLAGTDIGSVPQYVLDYAPVVYLHSSENWFPAPISSQLEHTAPQIGFANVTSRPVLLNLNTLDQVNGDGDGDGGVNVSLSSTQDFTKLPGWLRGTKPDEGSGKVAGSPSSAFIVRDVGNGTVFAFYMFFYAFNYGLLDTDLHVGDWEHFALRFDDGTPTQAWYSQHSGGLAYEFDALEKEGGDGGRPVVYSGNGTHANYPTAGDHSVLVFATDRTDKGTRWDPALSAYLVRFEPDDGHVAHGYFASYLPGDTSLAGSTLAPTAWLSYLGTWGDAQIPSTDPRQRGAGPLALYTAGPTGPQDKNLGRLTICNVNDNNNNGQNACKITSNISLSNG